MRFRICARKHSRAALRSWWVSQIATSTAVERFGSVESMAFNGKEPAVTQIAVAWVPRERHQPLIWHWRHGLYSEASWVTDQSHSRPQWAGFVWPTDHTQPKCMLQVSLEGKHTLVVVADFLFPKCRGTEEGQSASSHSCPQWLVPRRIKLRDMLKKLHTCFFTVVWIW